MTDVIDGDTVDVSTGERIRIIGIDTPERGQCGFAEATSHLESLVSGKTVALVPGARADKDRYGRLLRYVDTSDGIDVGLALVEADLAVSRYDSRDGYGGHAREASYTAADDGDGVNAHCATAAARVPAPAPAAVPTTVPAVATGDVHYRNCDAARAVGAAPLHRGDPGYRSGLDRDGDGTACE